MSAGLTDAILEAARAIHRLEKALAAKARLTRREADVLALVAEHPDATQASMVARSTMDATTMSSIIRDLQKRGLVSRRDDPTDARASRHRLTKKGEVAAEDVQWIKMALVSAVGGAVRRASEPAVRDALKGIKDAVTLRTKQVQDG